MDPTVVAVCKSPAHTLTKFPEPAVELAVNHGVVGDVHAGPTVRHRSRNPALPNLRQVHLVPAEWLDELSAAGFPVGPGTIGENVTTRGLDLLGLPTGARLRLGGSAVVELTGLRNPCFQLDGIKPGLKAACLGRDADGALVRKAGVMAVVTAGGTVRPGDPIRVERPAGEPKPLAPV
jgi:MOSC domain-containing protein YiiM